MTKIKLSIITLLTVFVTSSILISCSNEENLESHEDQNLSTNEFNLSDQILKLGSDPLLSDFLYTPKTFDASRLAQKNNKAGSNEFEITEVSQLTEIYGFNSDEETINFINHRSQIFEELNEKYNLENYTKEDLINALNNNEIQLGRFDCQKSCTSTMQNNAIIASATVIGAHAACLAADVTVILGIICHGVSHTIYSATINEIDNQYNVYTNGWNK